MLSSRAMPYASRIVAMTSACFTVSTPKSASRSRSRSSMSTGSPVARRRRELATSEGREEQPVGVSGQLLPPVLLILDRALAACGARPPVPLLDNLRLGSASLSSSSRQQRDRHSPDHWVGDGGR